MKDQREFFRITQQQLLEEQQRVPSLIAEDGAQECHPRQISISADLEGQALGFDCRRATVEAEEKSLGLALTRSQLPSESHPLRFPWLVAPVPQDTAPPHCSSLLPAPSGPFTRGICSEEPEPSGITIKSHFT